MTKLLVLVLIGVLAVLAHGQSNDDVNRVPIGPTQTPITVTPPTTTSTESPTTSTQPPTKPTEPPTTPTQPPTKPTTQPPTKPTQPPTKPTQPPTTKPTKPPTPPPTKPPTPTPAPPKPIPDPSPGTWEVDIPETNHTCILMKFALQISIPYNTTFNKTYKAYIDVPEHANTSGRCDNETYISMMWNEVDNDTNMVTFYFAKNATTMKYTITDIEVEITPCAKHFPGFNDTDPLKFHHKFDEFKTSLSKSYKCAKKQDLNLTDSTNVQKGTIVISNLQFEAFVNTTSKQFSAAEDCAPFDTPDVVPIAVGCALAALVLIVLVAYLFGRRRRQARGYLSMFTETKRESDYIPMKNLSCFQ